MDADDLEQIRQLKYTYFRLLDTKRFEDLGQLFVEDGTTAYDGGNLSQQGRAEIVAFLDQSLGSAAIVTMHNGHHPEISPTGDGTAAGVWYLEDRVFIPEADLVISGTAFYRDEYVKIGGAWRIAHTGYQRVYEEHRSHTTGALRSFRSRFQPG